MKGSLLIVFLLDCFFLISVISKKYEILKIDKNNFGQAYSGRLGWEPLPHFRTGEYKQFFSESYDRPGRESRIYPRVHYSGKIEIGNEDTKFESEKVTLHSSEINQNELRSNSELHYVVSPFSVLEDKELKSITEETVLQIQPSAMDYVSGPSNNEEGHITKPSNEMHNFEGKKIDRENSRRLLDRGSLMNFPEVHLGRLGTMLNRQDLGNTSMVVLDTSAINTMLLAGLTGIILLLLIPSFGATTTGIPGVINRDDTYRDFRKRSVNSPSSGFEFDGLKQRTSDFNNSGVVEVQNQNEDDRYSFDNSLKNYMMGLRESSLSTSILEKLVRDATEEIYRLHYSAVAEMDDIQKHKTKKYTNNIKEIPLNEQLLRTAEFKRTLQKFARKIQGHLDEDNGEECRKRFICEQLLKSHLKYGFIEEALRNLYSSEKKYKELFESRADVFSHYPYNVYRFEVKNVHCSRIFEKCSGL